MEWKRFEALLIEQAFIFEFFEHGYAPERGCCASCGKVAERKCFLKCAGCQSILYCAKSCQKLDWSRHRLTCKKVDNESREYLRENGIKISRRLVTLQLNRYWSSIVSLAQKHRIPPNRLGVQVFHDVAPFRIKVFDCQNVGKKIYDFDLRPIEPLIANEVIKERTKGRPCLMLVINHFGGVNVSYIVYLEEHLDPFAKKASQSQCGALVDEDGVLLFPGAGDIVGLFINKAHQYSDYNWRKFWGEKPFVYLVAEAK
ncbi:hypothetical protein SCHPADRAFT_926815, partial [Schizopora paradoxa]